MLVNTQHSVCHKVKVQGGSYNSSVNCVNSDLWHNGEDPDSFMFSAYHTWGLRGKESHSACGLELSDLPGQAGKSPPPQSVPL